ncbi:hypothetical protein [uncultured Microscilla sp.]|uniref:hypothetical protein n=1 Tax=uncultured Microscilla sp. TaxID=432653 RepID=UPI002634F483|nr:hypothetical protein [uncultured Microscilla sp.]
MQVSQNTPTQQPALPANIFNAASIKLWQQSLQARLEKLWFDAEEPLQLHHEAVAQVHISDKLELLANEARCLSNELKMCAALQKMMKI